MPVYTGGETAAPVAGEYGPLRGYGPEYGYAYQGRYNYYEPHYAQFPAPYPEYEYAGAHPAVYDVPRPFSGYYPQGANPGYPYVSYEGGRGPWYGGRPRASVGPLNEVLEDFKQKLPYDTKIDLLAYKGHILDIAKDQQGSRYLQQRMKYCTLEERKLVYEDLKEQVLALMSDVYGNYVIQVLMDCPEYRPALIEKLKGQVKRLAFDMYGCRCVQKAIEAGNETEKLLLLEELKPCLVECIESQNANHVLQKCIETVAPVHIAFIFDHCKQQVTGRRKCRPRHCATTLTDAG